MDIVNKYLGIEDIIYVTAHLKIGAMWTHTYYISAKGIVATTSCTFFKSFFFFFFFFYFKSQHLTSIIVEVAYRPRKLPDLPDYSREEKNINSSTRKCTSVIN